MSFMLHLHNGPFIEFLNLRNINSSIGIWIRKNINIKFYIQWF